MCTASTCPPGRSASGTSGPTGHYNVYHWLDRAGQTLGYYFNICDETRITAEVIEWRDLTVDVLAIPGGRLDVLDEHELPAELPTDVAVRIFDGQG